MQNSNVRNLKTETLSDNWYTLRKVTFEYLKKDGTWEVQQREAYMSPGSVTEILYFYIAEYTEAMKVGAGGGADDEQEEIEVLALNIDQAIRMVESGEIKDGKTIMLLQHIQLKGVFSN